MLGAMMGGSSPTTGPMTARHQATWPPASMSGSGNPVAGSARTAHQRGRGHRRGRRLGVPAQGIVIALAVASQESHFTNYANDGKGSDLAVLQAGVSHSLDLPHEAVGSDHGSVGVFQQQWPWWGNHAGPHEPGQVGWQVLRGPVQVPGWQTDAGHRGGSARAALGLPGRLRRRRDVGARAPGWRGWRTRVSQNACVHVRSHPTVLCGDGRDGDGCLPAASLGVVRRPAQLWGPRGPLGEDAHRYRPVRGVRNTGFGRDRRDGDHPNRPVMGRPLAGPGQHRDRAADDVVRAHAGGLAAQRRTGVAGSADRRGWRPGQRDRVSPALRGPSSGRLDLPGLGQPKPMARTARRPRRT